MAVTVSGLRTGNPTGRLARAGAAVIRWKQRVTAAGCAPSRSPSSAAPRSSTLADLPEPEPREPTSSRRHRRRRQLRRHAPGRGLVPGAAAAAADPRRRGRGPTRSGRQRVVALLAGRRWLRGGRRLRRNRRRRSRCPTGRRRRRARAGAAGHHGVAPAAHQRAPGSRRVGRRALGCRRRGLRWRVQLASAGVPAGSSPRRPAPRSASWHCDLGADVAIDLGPRPPRPGGHRATARGQRGRRVDVVLEMTGGHMFDGSVDALAPFGRVVDLRDGVAEAADPGPRRRR